MFVVPADLPTTVQSAMPLIAAQEQVGVTFDAPDHRARVAAVCRALEGMALAIELAASRLPAIGLDGLEAGLGDRLRVLTGGSRADERHSSLRATLDWYVQNRSWWERVRSGAYQDYYRQQYANR